MEQRFTVRCGNRETPCLLRRPDFCKPQRLVMGVHGIGGSMHDAIQESIADEMELFGSAVLRFDLPAHGENPEELMSLDACVETILDVAEFALKQFPDAQELCIFATGFGAYLTLNALQELYYLPCKLKLVIQTPTLRMDRRVLGLAHMNAVTMDAMEWAVLPGDRPLGITYDFYEELRENPALAHYPIPFLVLHGACDECVPLADIQQLRALNERAKLVVFPETHHSFQEPGAWDMVLDLTRDWFEFEQVLLADSY